MSLTQKLRRIEKEHKVSQDKVHEYYVKSKEDSAKRTEAEGKETNLLGKVIEQKVEIDNLKAMIQMQDIEINTRKANKKAEKKALLAGQKDMAGIIEGQDKVMHDIINMNIMVGEDIHSRARMNLERIHLLEQEMIALQAEPTVTRINYRRLLTKFRRSQEKNRMAAEEQRQEILRLHRVIDGKIGDIRELNFQRSRDHYLITTLRKKLG